MKKCKKYISRYLCLCGMIAIVAMPDGWANQSILAFLVAECAAFAWTMLFWHLSFDKSDLDSLPNWEDGE